MNKIKTSWSVIVVFLLAVCLMKPVFASEITGILTTGINGTVGDTITGTVIAPTPSPSSSGGGSSSGGASVSSSSGGGGGATIVPQVKGATSQKADQMTRAEILAKIVETKMLLIQLIQQLIIELQKQLLAMGH